MANTPTPRSYSEILGDMIDAFLSRYGLRGLKTGSPVLSMLESVAQSQLRSSEDIFTLLDAISLDNAEGLALDRIGADERVPRNTESPANGVVTVSDTSFVKKSSKIFQGSPAPIVGSVSVNVADASTFPATGSVYLGRGTGNYEGPIAYTGIYSPAPLAANAIGLSGGNYWTLVLATATARFHNLGESVVVAQGGLRTVSTGSIVQTPQGNVSNAITFRTLYEARIPDGEIEIQGVSIVALKPGITGNVTSAGGISAFASAPFAGATVSNPSPLTNGMASEADDAYRERIRGARAARVRGTALALQVFSVGVTAPDENKRVLSSSVVTRQGEPTILYIDDGTGYEEIVEGIAVESIVDSASGGEKFLHINSQAPVAKAFLLSTESAPFTLSGGQQLSFVVGGVPTIHTFDVDEFRSIGNATAYEVTASINGDPALNWSARTYASGTKVAVFAKADTNESIQNVAVADVGGVIVDANAYIGFPSGRADTMRLYKNDRLLSKDGEIAAIVSNPFSSWAALAGTQDLKLQVDGTSLSNLAGGTYSFTAQDFIDAATGYTTMGRNSAAAWAAVFNYRIPGITASVSNGLVYITSNRGKTGTAKLKVSSCSLATAGMFDVTASAVIGVNSDYTLNRNTGEFELATSLSAGDRLSAGSVNTRAFLESVSMGTITVAAGDAHFWFAVDGGASIITHGLTASTPIVFTASAKTWGFRVRATGTASMFTNVAVGDWVVFWDPTSPATLLDKSYRVAAVDAATSSWFEIDRGTTYTHAGYTFTNSGVSFVRADSILQKVTIPAAANYTAAGAAPLLTAALTGGAATASVYKTTELRVNTTTFDEAVGDIALVAADSEAQKFKIPVSDAVANITGHMASMESAASEVGTPDFHESAISLVAGPRVFWSSETPFPAPSPGSMVVGLRPYQDGSTTATTRSGNNVGYATALASITTIGGDIYALVERTAPQERLLEDRVYFASAFALAEEDSLAVLVDGDTDTKRFTVPMWRSLSTVGTTYAAQNTYKDADNGGQSLSVGFGYTGNDPFDFNDFAIFMAARAKTHDQGTYSSQAGGVLGNLNKTVLWRWHQLGPNGEKGRVHYTIPAAPSLPVTVTTDNLSDAYNNVSIALASGAQRTGYTLDNSDQIAYTSLAPISGMSPVYFILGYPIASAQRTANVTTLTLTLPIGVAASGLPTTLGSLLYVTSTSGSFTSGAKQLLTSVGATVTYTETAADAGPTLNIGSISVGPTARNFSGAGIVSGDFVHIDTTVTVPNYNDITFRILNDPMDPLIIGAWVENFATNDAGVINISSLGNASGFKIYENLKQTVSTIVGAVNVLIAADASIPVRPTLIGNGSGTIDRSTAEDAAVASTWISLVDGMNYVQTTVNPAALVNDFEFLFKNAINANLATNSDWANEDVRIVPRTAKNVVDWLNRPTVSGLFSVADVERSSNAHKIQIASLTPGSSGSIQAQGGTANSVTAAVHGSAQLVSPYAVATIQAADAQGFMAGAWCAIDNTGTTPKSVFASGTILNSLAASGDNYKLTFSTALYAASSAPTSSCVVAVERQGNFVAIYDSGEGNVLNSDTVSEGDWVRITAPAAAAWPVAAINTGNIGIFRVVRVVRKTDHAGFGGCVWIENAGAVIQALAECDVFFYTNDSVMPGDFLSISTSKWNGDSGASNNGTYQVVSVGDNGAGPFTATGVMIVAGAMNVITAPAAALGSSLPQAQVIEGTPNRSIKRIFSTAPHFGDASLVDVKFSTSAQYGRIGAAPGSVITLLDKLNFPLTVAEGLDGYRHSVGLIGEVNKVIYGDPSDTATYPGVAAAGALVNIEGALVKRIQLTISLRIRSGSTRTEIADLVKSALAGIVNAAGVGQSVSLSDLVTAAGKVGGVVTAVMVNPAATSSNDLIVVQPYEKARILNVDQDITVTFVGEG